jgi:hypothetical protein
MKPVPIPPQRVEKWGPWRESEPRVILEWLPRPGRFPSMTDAFVELAAEPIDQRLEVVPLPKVRTRGVGRQIVEDTLGVVSIPGPLQ